MVLALARGGGALEEPLVADGLERLRVRRAVRPDRVRRHAFVERVPALARGAVLVEHVEAIAAHQVLGVENDVPARLHQVVEIAVVLEAFQQVVRPPLPGQREPTGSQGWCARFGRRLVVALVGVGEAGEHVAHPDGLQCRAIDVDLEEVPELGRQADQPVLHAERILRPRAEPAVLEIEPRPRDSHIGGQLAIGNDPDHPARAELAERVVQLQREVHDEAEHPLQPRMVRHQADEIVEVEFGWLGLRLDVVGPELLVEVRAVRPRAVVEAVRLEQRVRRRR